MALFEKVLKATVMTTELFIKANVSKTILYESYEIAKKFEKKYSAYDSSSLLCHINALSGIKPFFCTPQELEIFQKAFEIAQTSNGCFDPTIGVLTQGSYGFGTQEEKIPTNKELQKKKELVNYKNMEINKKSIYLNKKGMQLDLGGIGKGYVADKLLEYLLKRGATKALVSVGGEIVSFGARYKVAIRNPFFKEENFAIISTTKKVTSISTSGDYERYIGSQEYHHILDNKSAKQNHYYKSVTLLQNEIDASFLDGVATVVFNTPLEKLESLATKYQISILVITPQKTFHMYNFSILQIENIEIYPSF